MPQTASAKKALRQNEKRRLQNRAQRSALRTLLKKFRAAVTEGQSREAIEPLYRQAQKKLDQAAAKHLIHKNTAARIKSRLVAFKKKHTAAPASGT